MAFVDGWMHTGDLATVDADGYVTIVDRKKDIIISGGINVHSREVEEVLLRHPDVGQAAAIGVPDPQWGEAVHAIVVPAPGATVDPDDVLEFCATQLAGYKKPRTDRGARRAADQRHRQGPRPRAEGASLRAHPPARRAQDPRRTRCRCLISCATRPSGFPTVWP